MNRYRHRRLRTCLSILAIVALLWSQIVLAGHPMCSMAAMALAEVATPASAEQDCHPPGSLAESAFCKAHCSQGDQSSEVGRVPPVPAAAPALAFSIASIMILEANHAPDIDLSPPVSWHWPTSHPASLLLI